MDISKQAKEEVIKFHQDLVDKLLELLEMEIINIDMTAGKIIRHCLNEIEKFKSNSTS